MTRQLKIMALALSALLLFAPIAPAGGGGVGHGGGGGGFHGGGGGGFHGGGVGGGGFHGGGGGGFHGGGAVGSGSHGGGARGGGFHGGGAVGNGFRDGGFRGGGFHDRGFDRDRFRDRDFFFGDDYFYGSAFFGPWWLGYDSYGFYDPYGYGPSDATGQIKIEKSAKDTQVYVDGGYAGTVKELGKFPLSVGAHDLELRSPDGRSFYKAQLDVIAGKTLQIKP